MFLLSHQGIELHRIYSVEPINDIQLRPMRWNMHSVSNISTSMERIRVRVPANVVLSFRSILSTRSRGSFLVRVSIAVPNSHSAHWLVRLIHSLLEALQLRVRSACIIDGTSSCPPDLHSYFLKLVETPSQQRKKQSLIVYALSLPREMSSCGEIQGAGSSVDRPRCSTKDTRVKRNKKGEERNEDKGPRWHDATEISNTAP